MNYDVGCRMSEIDESLRENIKLSMQQDIKLYGTDAIGSAFDLAVETAYNLNLANEDNDYEIPVYVVEIAESIMGPDDPSFAAKE